MANTESRSTSTFLVSDRDGYRRLRQLLTGTQGVGSITRPGRALEQVRELRADQYGLRTMLKVEGIEIKFEIVLEARIALENPGPADHIHGVATLTPLDMAASKLLALSDRWRDDAVFSRDLIDLAMMAPPRKLLRQAIDKARGAYGDSIESDLAKAVEDLRTRPHRLDDCMQAMQMTGVSKAMLWSRIKGLAPQAGMPAARRLVTQVGAPCVAGGRGSSDDSPLRGPGPGGPGPPAVRFAFKRLSNPTPPAPGAHERTAPHEGPRRRGEPRHRRAPPARDSI